MTAPPYRFGRLQIYHKAHELSRYVIGMALASALCCIAQRMQGGAHARAVFRDV